MPYFGTKKERVRVLIADCAGSSPVRFMRAYSHCTHTPPPLSIRNLTGFPEKRRVRFPPPPPASIAIPGAYGTVSVARLVRDSIRPPPPGE